jgi:hypothetical protein
MGTIEIVACESNTDDIIGRGVSKEWMKKLGVLINVN